MPTDPISPDVDSDIWKISPTYVADAVEDVMEIDVPADATEVKIEHTSTSVSVTWVTPDGAYHGFFFTTDEDD